MAIPNADAAFVPAEKIADYLLNVSHPVGGSKAQWFLSMGYDVDGPERLADDLLGIARGQGAPNVHASPFGVKYELTGETTAPNGRRVFVTTVWIIDTGETAPRLVTGYPAEETEP